MTPTNNYLISRQPKALKAKIRPFDSLDATVWAAISFNYTFFIISCIIIFFKLKSHLPQYERSKFVLWISLEAIFDPSSLTWQKIIKSGLLFQLLIIFNTWSLNVLYGMNLRAVLIKQDFEIKVNSWKNLKLFETHVVVMWSADNSLISPSPVWLYNKPFYGSTSREIFHNRSSPLFTNYYSENSTAILSKVMQNNPSPSDLVMITTEYVIQSTVVAGFNKSFTTVIKNN